MLSADEWNERYPVGTSVDACPGLMASEGGRVIYTATRTPAWTLASGEAVVSVMGYAGGIALTHIRVHA